MTKKTTCNFENLESTTLNNFNEIVSNTTADLHTWLLNLPIYLHICDLSFEVNFNDAGGVTITLINKIERKDLTLNLLTETSNIEYCKTIFKAVYIDYFGENAKNFKETDFKWIFYTPAIINLQKRKIKIDII